MNDHNRRTLMKAAGASLLGLTVSGTASSADPNNVGVSLLEASLSFDFGNVENLDWSLSDRPTKYAIDPDEGTLEARTVTRKEANALTTSDRLVNFHGIDANVDAIGGTEVNSLFRRGNVGETQGTYVYTRGGYNMPILDIDWNAETLPRLLSSDRTAVGHVEDDFIRLQLPSQEVTVRKKIVHDELVEDESLPEWKRSKVIERPEVSVVADPYLTVAYHPDLDVVGID